MNGHVSSKLLSIFPFQTVFRTLVSQILDRAEPLLPSSLPLEVVTVFQYYGYFTSHGVSDLETHLNQLAKQGGTRSLSHCALAPFGVHSGLFRCSV